MQVNSRREPARGPDWQRFGACRDEDPELFFPEGQDLPAIAQAGEAVAVCVRCPVLDACRRQAMSTRERHGVWGGLTEQQRAAMFAAADTRRAGRVA